MLRVAIVGCGRIARRHADLLGRSQIHGAQLSAVCDLVPARATEFGETYGVPSFTDMHDMMSQADVDVVVILTESGNHATHAIALAPHGKHIVVEKPMALTVEDADAMIAACERSGVRLFVVKQNRFNVPVVKTREALDAGRLGRMVLGTVRVRWSRPQSYYDQAAWRGTWAMDGGVLANQASHHVDMLQWMMGDAVSVHARGITASAKIQAEDTAVATVRFASGALGVIEATTAVRPKDLEGSLSLIGDQGTIEIAGFAVNHMRHWQFVDAHPGDADVLERYSVNPPNVYGFGHQAYYQHLVTAITTNTPALVDGHEGRRSLALLSAIYESIASGTEQPVPAPRIHSRLGRRHG
jgi:UDP-N-acetyl-2-amino-2-deoxyglucuronate dehydrogenase